MRRALACLSLVVLVAAPLALAGVVDRAQVGLQGRNETRGFSPSLYVVLASPPDYARGCCYDSDSGEWNGPRYQAQQRADLGGTSTIDWSVAFARASSAEAAARAALVQAWPDVQAGQAVVSHTIAGSSVGTIAGFYVITRARGESAQHEAAVAFPISHGVVAVARFFAKEPFTDTTGGVAGSYVVNGVLASTWNREQITSALQGVSLDGSLPPARVTARATGRAVRGTVTDAFLHPVAGATATLERRTRAGWRPSGHARTSATGAFALRAAKRGTYRVSAALAGSVARSAPVRVR
jgi:hypothetical protein